MSEKEENKRLQLTPEEVEQRKRMLFEEENKKKNAERGIEYYEDEDCLRMARLRSELQLLELKQQLKTLPHLEEEFKQESYKQQIQNSIKLAKEQLRTADQNIKTLRRQINTGMA